MVTHEYLGRLSLARVGRLALLVCLAGLGLSAHAVTDLERQALTGFAAKPGGGYVRTPSWTDPSSVRNWSMFSGNAATGRVIATDAVAVAARAGPLAVSTAARVGLADAALAVARCVAGGGLLCGAATAAAAVYGAYRVYNDGTNFMGDPGQNSLPAFVYQGNGRQGVVKGDSASTVCSIIRDQEETYINATNVDSVGAYGSSTTYTKTITINSLTETVCQLKIHITRLVVSCNATQCLPPSDTIITNNALQNNALSKTAGQLCPAVVDALNPAYSVPYGQLPGDDGKCKTARYNHAPTTPEAATEKVVANPPTTFPSQKWVDGLKGAIESGQKAPATVTTTGPSTQTGTPTVTTTTSGAGTMTKTETPTYAYSYAGDTINVSTTTTTITNNAGDITTTTTNAAPTGSQEATDPCIANPDRVGCMRLGVPPDDQIAKKNVTLTYDQESLGLPSGCPAPHSVMIAGTMRQISYDTVCDAAIMMAPWVKAAGAMASVLMVLAALRQT